MLPDVENVEVLPKQRKYRGRVRDSEHHAALVYGEKMSPTRSPINRDTSCGAQGTRAANIIHRRMPGHNIDNDQPKAGGENYVIASLNVGLPLRRVAR
jgi:hypothetical protein